jgi:nucleotide-binding universal stress UspA family protein
MKKILCLIDFSAPSEEAARLGVQMARRAGGLLTLLHVVHLPVTDTSETALMAGELMAGQKEDAERKLKEICDRIQVREGEQEAPALTVNCLVQEALLADAVEQMTSGEGYGLVLMGKTGTGNSLEEILVGSNTETVIHQVKCPVLALPEEADRRPIRKIIYATDYDAHDLVALREVRQVADLLGALIEAVHITEEPTAEAPAFARRLQEAFPEGDIGFAEYPFGDEEAGLQAFLREREGDMLAMLKKEAGFFTYLFRRSLTDQIAYHTQVPLLVVQGRGLIKD